jgi:hypothetical protein
MSAIGRSKVRVEWPVLAGLEPVASRDAPVPGV